MKTKQKYLVKKDYSEVTINFIVAVMTMIVKNQNA